MCHPNLSIPVNAFLKCPLSSVTRPKVRGRVKTRGYGNNPSCTPLPNFESALASRMKRNYAIIYFLPTPSCRRVKR